MSLTSRAYYCSLAFLLYGYLIGLGAAADIPLILNENSSLVDDSALNQPAYLNSPQTEIGEVYPVLMDSDAIMILQTGGGKDKKNAVNMTVGELKSLLRSKVQPDNSYVHNVALVFAGKNSGEHSIDQICSIYEFLKNGNSSVKGWSYVADPRSGNIYNYAEDTLKAGTDSGCSGVGNCDDFAIAMSSLLESIGATTRIVVAYNGTNTAHAYTEVCIGRLGDKNSQVLKVIQWLIQNYMTDEINIHKDSITGDFWLNLDWGADEYGINRPGGPFFQGDTNIIVTIRENDSMTFVNGPQGYDPAEAWYKRGEDLYNHGNSGLTREAIKAFDKAVELNPHLVDAWYLKGDSHDLLNENDEALKAYDKVIELSPRDNNTPWDSEVNIRAYRVWYSKGNILSRTNRYEEAINAYNKALEIETGNEQAITMMGETFIKMGRYDEAISCFDKITQRFADYVYDGQGTPITGIDAYRDKGLALLKAGRYNESVQAYQRAVELDPTQAWSWHDKGNALREQGKYDEALQAYNKTLEIAPTNPYHWIGKGNVSRDQGNYSEALYDYTKAAELIGECTAYSAIYSITWKNIGISLKALHRNEEADIAFAKAVVPPVSTQSESSVKHEEEIETSLVTDRDTAEAWYDRALAFDKKGNYDDAFPAYDKSTELDPHNAEAWYRKGFILWFWDRNGEALQALDKSIELKSHDERAWNVKGRVLSNLGRYNESIQAFDKAIENNPNLDEAWNGKGLALKNLGRYEEALVAFENSIKVNPKWMVPWNNKGLILRILGRQNEADAAFAKARELGYEHAGNRAGFS